MTLLSPLALLWLASVPVLLWLWRLASTHRRVAVPSLIPFEHLLQRPARRRTRLVVNTLFWLQLAALLGLTFALTQPLLHQRRAKSILVILDTSASMGAQLRGPRAFERAARALITRIARKAPADQVLILTSAPLAALTPQPTSEAERLKRAVQSLQVSHLGGNLSTTVRVGRALLGTDPDETLVVTDEPQPSEPLAEGVRWVSVGEPLPNVAIVGLDVRGSLCDPAQARLVATIQNFSNETSSVSAVARSSGRRLAEVSETLAPRARRALPLALPEGTQGWIELTLAGPPDGLEADNRAWVSVSNVPALPIVVHSASPTFKQTMSAWLSSCQALVWSMETAPVRGAHLMITDHEDNLLPSTAAALLFIPPARPRTKLSRWLISSGHPIGFYLNPIEAVAASLNVSEGTVASGIPVVSALVDGRKVPIVIAEQRDDRRIVSMRLDPAGSKDSIPVLLTFFNSLRWLMGHSNVATTDEPLTLTGFQPGTVRIQRPDGSLDTAQVDRGAIHYEADTLAGRYQVSQGSSEVMVAVNFFDPLESNLLDRVSTWHVGEAFVARRNVPRHSTLPLASLLTAIVLVLIVIEWWRYSLKGQSLRAQGSGFGALAPTPEPPAQSPVLR